jgi:cytochrome c556
MSRALTIAALMLALAGVAQAAPKGSAMQQQMKAVVEPASNTLFAVGGEVDPANGPDAAKVPAGRWTEAASAAAQLQQAAAALQTPAFAKDQGAWLTEAKKMAAVSAVAASAATARNGQALAQAANDLSDVCSACHAKYKPQG